MTAVGLIASSSGNHQAVGKLLLSPTLTMKWAQGSLCHLVAFPKLQFICYFANCTGWARLSHLPRSLLFWVCFRSHVVHTCCVARMTSNPPAFTSKAWDYRTHYCAWYYVCWGLNSEPVHTKQAVLESVLFWGRVTQICFEFTLYPKQTLITELGHSLASASQVLKLQACVTIPHFYFCQLY